MALLASAPLLLAALAGAVALLLPGAAEARVLLSLDDFGAVGDGIANDTQAFVDAWEAACATGGNTYLNVPAGKSYQIWPVTLAGPCRGEIKLMVFIPPSSPSATSQSQSQYTLANSCLADFREHHRAGEPGGVGGRRPRQVAPLHRRGGPVSQRRRHRRRPGPSMVGGGLRGRELHLVPPARGRPHGAPLRGLPGRERQGPHAAEQPAAAPGLHPLLQRRGQLPPGHLAGVQPRHR
uniref:Pectate lyase superfamily protein domain-containing protein n=1 Tax=Aegilops tauschii subsp. strangulata TaxID=200361 RepID=A0A452ZQN1_AEGTS